MARPLRLEHGGALYHVTARGDPAGGHFFENEDWSDFLSILGEVCGRFNWVVQAYCQMTNHYHGGWLNPVRARMVADLAEWP